MSKKSPQLRFEGFTDDWELRKLGDTVIEIIAGGDIDKNKVVEFGKYPIYANSHSGDGIVGYYDDFYRVNGPAVTVTGRGEVGFAKARETDFTPVVRLLAIRSKHNHCFLENAINLHGVTVESTGVPQLTVPQLSAYRIYFPYDIQEENQIGTFFSTLDQQITLHQRKLDKLKSVKQAYLSEMFPAEGERVPKRRFPGFTDDWELRKLGEVAEIVMGQSPDSKNYTDNPLDNILVQGNADLRDGCVVPRVWTTQVTKTAEKGDLILSVRAPVGDVGRTNYNVVLGRGVAGIKGNEFIYHLLVKMKLFGYWTKLSTGSTFESINSDDIKNSTILFPSHPEQEAIGTFFSTLDRHITLHQRKS